MTGINSFFWLLIMAHLIGDFFLQSDKIVNGKKEKLRYQLIHSLLYAIPFLFLFTNSKYLWCTSAFLVIVISHFFIDFVKIQLTKKSENREIPAFFVDQFLHLVIIYLVALSYATSGKISLNRVGIFLVDLFISLNTGLNAATCVRTACAFLLILKPANIVIRVLKPQINQQRTSFLKTAAKPVYESIWGKKLSEDGQSLLKAGSTIGILERILMLILLLYGQYTAIGFVLAAKTLTRYNKISESPAFAEYYLIGTLSSVIIAVIASLIAK